jgi:hypothetical protein
MSGVHVYNLCPRLSDAQYDEVDARVLLLLRSEPRSYPLPAIACDEDAAWLERDGRRFELPGRSIPDEVVAAMDAELHQGATSEPSEPAPKLSASLPAALPSDENAGRGRR